MSKPTSAWMPFYVGDYLGDTQRLTTEQHGAYLLLMLDYWRNGPPPDDDSVLQQITKLDRASWKKCRPILARMFQIAEGEWRHKRIDKELEDAQKNAQRRSEKAQAGARARWGRCQEDAPSNAPSMPEAMLDECAPPSPSQAANAASACAREPEDVIALTARLCRASKITMPDPSIQFDRHRDFLSIVASWLDTGAKPEKIEECVAARAASSGWKAKSLRYFDGAVRDAAQAQKQEITDAERMARSILQRTETQQRIKAA